MGYLLNKKCELNILFIFWPSKRERNKIDVYYTIHNRCDVNQELLIIKEKEKLS